MLLNRKAEKVYSIPIVQYIYTVVAFCISCAYQLLVSLRLSTAGKTELQPPVTA